MSYLACTGTVRTGNTAPAVTQYLGVDGIRYNVLNREIIVIPNNLVLSAGLTPYIQSPLVRGDYTVLTFALTIDDPDGRTKGTSQICIGGTEITPTPTPTFVPTLTPTPTPVPPTPTPTATPVL